MPRRKQQVVPSALPPEAAGKDASTPQAAAADTASAEQPQFRENDQDNVATHTRNGGGSGREAAYILEPPLT